MKTGKKKGKPTKGVGSKSYTICMFCGGKNGHKVGDSRYCAIKSAVSSALAKALDGTGDRMLWMVILDRTSFLRDLDVRLRDIL